MNQNLLDHFEIFLIRHIDQLHNNLEWVIDNHFGYSYEYLRKNYRVKTGRSIKHRVREIQLDIAVSRLKSDDTPIVDIAKDLGFRSGASFTKWFKKYKELSPSVFRGKYSMIAGVPNLSNQS